MLRVMIIQDLHIQIVNERLAAENSDRWQPGVVCSVQCVQDGVRGKSQHGRLVQVPTHIHDVYCCCTSTTGHLGLLLMMIYFANESDIILEFSSALSFPLILDPASYFPLLSWFPSAAFCSYITRFSKFNNSFTMFFFYYNIIHC